MEKVEVQDITYMPDGLFDALGRVSVRYGQIEHFLTLTIKRTDQKMVWDQAFAFVEKLRYSNKIREEARRRFNAWADEHFDEIIAEKEKRKFRAAVNDWKKLAARRGEIVHCCWSVGRNGNLNATRRGKILRDDTGRPVDVAYVNRLADRMHSLAARLNAATLPNP